MTESSKFLPVHEWIAVVTILFFMLLFISITSLNKRQIDDLNLNSHPLLNQEIEVYLQGAVKSPGRVIVQKGSSLGQVLKPEILTDFADLSSLNMKKKLRAGEHIVIPEIQYITIFIKGAVKAPFFIILPKNVKMCEILPFLTFNKDANLERLSKRHYLTDGDRITIPSKKKVFK